MMDQSGSGGALRRFRNSCSTTGFSSGSPISHGPYKKSQAINCQVSSFRNDWAVPLSFSLLLFLSKTASVAAEEGDDSSKQTSMPDEEVYMIIFCSVSFSVVITLFGTIVGYFSVVQDSLMRQYKQSGEVVHAQIVHSGFCRGAVGTKCCSETNNATEYSLNVEYTYWQQSADETGYAGVVRIGKPVKAFHTDIVVPSYIVAQQQQTPPELTRCLLPLYVVPGYPKSGQPCRQVERTCGWRYRLMTIAFVVSTLLIAAFCVKLAIDVVEGRNETPVHLYSMALFTMVLVMEVFFVHFAMRGCLVQALTEEYLESGDILSGLEHADSSTLSSESGIFQASLSFDPALDGKMLERTVALSPVVF